MTTVPQRYSSRCRRQFFLGKTNVIFYFFETPTNLDSESKVSEESVQVYSGKKEIEIRRQADFFWTGTTYSSMSSSGTKHADHTDLSALATGLRHVRASVPALS